MTSDAIGNEEEGTFTLLLFASAQSYADDTESLTLPAPMTLGQLFQELEKRYPGIGPKILASSGVSVNLEYIDFVYEDLMEEWKDRDEGRTAATEAAMTSSSTRKGQDGRKVEVFVIKKGDEVGIIPPVSSG